MAIIINDVSYIYNESTPFEHTALKDINLTIEEEKVTGIIGRVGSGKSTFIELLNGLLIPSTGSIKIAGFDITKGMKSSDLQKLRRKVGLVFQSPRISF